ncbi:acyltransferase [Rugosimonospora acidiphila]|uniref:Acyltransferase n=1 Tax=Rugosimonospora acidiphila TaxID=556531 RepID=A0ABP9SFE1_9ACTN
MDNQPAVATRDRSPSLTGLRAWAAGTVVVYHLSTEVGQLPVFSELFRFGRMGVTLFFVLSGFVLTYTYDGRRISKRTFYWRRFVRIWPLHILVLAGSAAVLIALGATLSAKHLAPSVVLLHAWLPNSRIVGDTVGASWSLSDEAFFYALFPFLLPFVAKRFRYWRQTIAILFGCYAAYFVIVSLTLHGYTQSWALDYLPVVRISQFIAGMAIGVAFKRGVKAPVSLRMALLLTIGWVAVTLVWARVPWDFPFQPYSGSQAFAFPVFALLIWALAERDRAGRSPWLVASPIAIRLGHWSYAWYLAHKVTFPVWTRIAGQPHTGRQIALAWVVIFVSSLILAGLLYQLWERPVERWLKPRLLGREGPPSGSGPTAGGSTGSHPTGGDSPDPSPLPAASAAGPPSPAQA